MRKISKLKISWNNILPIIGITIFVYLLKKIGVGEIWMTIRQADIRYLAFLPIFIVLSLTVQTLKWNILLRRQNIFINFTYLFKVQLISHFYGMVTPAKIGSLIKIFYLKKKTQRDFGSCSTSVIVDRFLDALTLSALVVSGTLVLFGHFSNLFLQLLPLFLLLLTGGIFFHNKRRVQTFSRLIPGFLTEQRFVKKLKTSFDSFYEFMPKKTYLTLPLLLAAINWFLLYTEPFIIFRSLNTEINFFVLVFACSLATTIGLIPVTISGLGTREATLIMLLGLYKIDAQSAVAMSLLALVLGACLPASIGGVLALTTSRPAGSKDFTKD